MQQQRSQSSSVVSRVILAVAVTGAALLIFTGGPWTQLSSGLSAWQQTISEPRIDHGARCDQLNQQYLRIPSFANKAEYEHECGTAATAAAADAALLSNASQGYQTMYGTYAAENAVQLAKQEQAAYADKQCGRLPGYPTALQ